MTYGLTAKQLRVLFENRDQPEQLEQLGGLEGIAQKLNVDLSSGANQSSIEGRRSTFGENRIPERPPKTYMELLWAALQDVTIMMLCAAAVVSIIICIFIEEGAHNCYIEGIAICGTVLLVSNVAANMDYQKEKQFRRLNAEVENIKVNVTRDGQNVQVSKYDIVVGDIVRLSIGDILEGDGILMDGFDVATDESALTGEPILINKTPKKPFMFSGSSIQNGQGRYLVIAVGVNSENGRIQALVRGHKLVDQEDEAPAGAAGGGAATTGGGEGGKTTGESPKAAADDDDDGESGSVLTKKLDTAAANIGKAAITVASIAFVCMMVRWILRKHVIEDDPPKEKFFKELVNNWIITTITIVVVAVPEGLPLAVTLSLSLSVKKMQADACLVKHLDATETMGSATSICTDKTGTLTQNRMTVTKCALGDGSVESSTPGQTCGQIMVGKTPDTLKELIGMGICQNKAEAEIKWSTTTGRWDQIGNKTDCALLAFAVDLGYDYREMTNIGMKTAINVYPFSSDRKRAGLVVPNGDKYRIYLKGASEIILSLCDYQIHPSTGSAMSLTPDKKREIIDGVVTPFAKASLRTIALAYADFDSAQDWEAKLTDEEAVALTGQSAETYRAECGVTLCAMVGIEDPLRESVPPAIIKCNTAGIDVRMVTGDNIDTAIAISKQCGILRPGIDIDENGNPLNKFVAMTGPDFRKRVLDPSGAINQEKFDQVWPYLRVLARSSPTDKYNLVSGIIESALYEDPNKVKELQISNDRQVVAVTGDGTNDAPALKRADVGFVMGITGTSVAKDAADIIITDDDFSSIVEACKWGRNVYDSISKFLQFQLTINIVAVSLSCLGAVTVGAAPLSAVQMLWVNLIMDSLGALALASEPPIPELLMRPPYGRNQSLLSFHMKFNMFGHAVLQMIVLVTLLFLGAGDAGAGEVCDVSQIAGNRKCTNCGGFLDIPSGSDRKSSDPPSQHYTIIFNTFVMMQLFNWINCRKIYHEFNVFEGMLDNKIFCGIWLLCFLMQCLIVEFGAIGDDPDTMACTGKNPAFKTVHLNGSQWLFCLVVGVCVIPWQMMLVVIARTFFPHMEHKSTEGGALRTTPVPRRVSGASSIVASPAIQNGDTGGVGTGSGRLQTFPSGASSVSNGARQASRVKTANQQLNRQSSSGRLSDKQKTVEMFRANNASKERAHTAAGGAHLDQIKLEEPPSNPNSN